jgi:hypothetical protein
MYTASTWSPGALRMLDRLRAVMTRRAEIVHVCGVVESNPPIVGRRNPD